jgi:hypothetical protein
MGANRKRIVTAAARLAVEATLKAIVSKDGSVDDYVATASELDKFGDERIGALSERLSDENPKTRVAAAALLLAIAASSAGSLDASTQAKATRIIVAVLKTGSNDEKLRACSALTAIPVPPSAIDPLRALLDDPDDRLKIIAAVALASDASSPEGLAVLARALDRGSAPIQALAASAFVRAGVRSEAIDRLFEALAEVDAEAQYRILFHLKLSGPAAGAALPHLEQIITDESRHFAPRRAAIAVMASAAPDIQTAAPILLKALRSSDWRVATAAVGAFSELGGLPDKALAPLKKHLSSADEELRRLGARGLKLMGAKAAGAIDALIAQGRVDRNIFVMEEMSEALAAIGPSIIPRLIELLKGSDIGDHVLSRNALVKMSAAAAPALAEALLSASDGRFQRTIVTIITLIWEEAASAVPALATVLDETQEDETAYCAMMALFACGRPAVAAAPALIRRFIGTNEELAGYAKQVLLKVGASAVPALHEAMIKLVEVAATNQQALLNLETATAPMLEEVIAGLMREQIEHIADLAFELETGLDATLRRYMAADRELLELFVAVVDILVDNGPQTQVKLAKLVKERIADGRLSGPAFKSVSARNIAVRIGHLSEQLNNVQFFRKWGHLTPKAMDIYSEIVDFLRVTK